MFKIIDAKTGAEIGITEKPRYIKKKAKSGAFVPTDKENAQGIAFEGKPYNLIGKDGIGVEDTVILVEYDGGEVPTALAEQSAVIDSLIISTLEPL